MPTPQSSGADSSARQHIYDVFLSHHSGDKPQVEALAARLEDEEGLKPFLDKWHLIPGEPWQESLEEALDQSGTCAVFLGPGGLGPWENEEMHAALDERVRNKSFRVIPVLLPAVHNYYLTWRDGTTAAERFFGAKPRDLFGWLVDRLDVPARPAAKRSNNGRKAA